MSAFSACSIHLRQLSAHVRVTFQRVYVSCARQLKRLDAIKRSPLYAFFHETLNGVSSVRAYGQQRRFTLHSDKLLDNNQRVWFEVFTSNRLEFVRLQGAFV